MFLDKSQNLCYLQRQICIALRSRYKGLKRTHSFRSSAIKSIKEDNYLQGNFGKLFPKRYPVQEGGDSYIPMADSR